MSSKKKKNTDEYSCIQKDETAAKVGSELIWLLGRYYQTKR